MAFSLVMEALARIEHKLDAIMRHTRVPMPAPMHFSGSVCPGCSSLIDYQVDVIHQVVVRRCACKTGKVASMIPLSPVEGPKFYEERYAEGAAEDPSERPRRRDQAGDLRRPGRG